jgi:hypothetical protein
VKYPLVVLPIAAAAAAFAVNPSPEAAAWWAHVLVLADDKMEGRKAGTTGHSKAVEYVAKQFSAAGLKAGGTNGYLQPIRFNVRQIVEEKSQLSLVRNDRVEPLTLGEDAYLNPRDASERVIDAPAVFVGHGLKIPEMNIDDLKGLDLEGKIVVYISAAPKTVPGPIAAHAQSSAQRWANYRAAGAIGTASIADPATRDIPWKRASLTRFQPVLAFADPGLSDTTGQQAAIVLNADKADRLFSGTPHTVKGLLELHRSGKPLPKFPLAAAIRVKTAFVSNSAVSENVIGILPGSDAKLAHEYVVLSAHLDHLGTGRPIDGDAIYNGAMDNASGVATLIEIAKSLADSKPKRSIVMAAVTAEEGGLMGSRYFAANPTVPAQQIVANINLDMFLPIIPLKAITVYGIDESDLGSEFAAAAQRFGVRSERDPQPERNSFIRSDQYSFIRRGIPALTFKFHAAPGSAEDQVLRNWRTSRYHGVKDDVEQPVQMEDAVKFNRVLTAFTEQIANRSQPPHWKQDSFFRRYARKP